MIVLPNRTRKSYFRWFNNSVYWH